MNPRGPLVGYLEVSKKKAGFLQGFKRCREGGMAESDEEVERLWEGEEEEMDEEDKDWLIQRLREKDIHQ